MLDNWQRIEKIVDWTGLSVNAFAMRIGLNRAENLYQIKKGNNGISKELATQIANRYPNVNRNWLITGDGEPFLDEKSIAARGLPYYKTEVATLMRAPHDYTPAGYLSVPQFMGSQLAALNVGTAMLPRIPDGACVFIRKSTLKRLSPGNIYLIISPTFNGIRIIRRLPEKPDELRLVPCNSADFDEMILSAGEVESIWEVAGYLMTL